MPEFTPDDLATIQQFRDASARLNQMFERLVPTERVIRVTAGQDLQGVVNTLPTDTTIELEAGAVFGPLLLPNLPGSGRRIVGGSGSVIAAEGGWAALRTAPGAHDWEIDSLSFLGSGYERDVVRLGAWASALQATLADVPQRLTLRNIIVWGGNEGQHRGIALNAGETTLEHFSIHGIRRKDNGDAAGIGGGNGPGPYTIRDGSIEAAGINIIFGGVDPTIHGLVPSDITIENLVTRKPLAWRTEGWAVKNHFELKNARRVRVRNYRIENQWTPSHGVAITLKSVNQGAADSMGTASGAPWCVVEDVVFENLEAVNVCGGVKILANPDGMAQPARNITIRNARFDVRSAELGGNGWACYLQTVDQVTLDRVSLLTDAPAALFAEVGPNPHFAMLRSLIVDNAYGIKGAGRGEGFDTLANYFPGAYLVDNAVVTSSPQLYPGFATFPPPLAQYLDETGQFFLSDVGWRK